MNTSNLNVSLNELIEKKIEEHIYDLFSNDTPKKKHPTCAENNSNSVQINGVEIEREYAKANVIEAMFGINRRTLLDLYRREIIGGKKTDPPGNPTSYLMLRYTLVVMPRVILMKSIHRA